jgi:outer membrane protein OmpA-like peptidoglycan-associated protein
MVNAKGRNAKRRHLAVAARLSFTLFVGAANATPILAQPAPHETASVRDVAGARDYAGLPRFRGSTIVGYQALSFDTFRLPTGRAERDANSNWQMPNVLTLEGKVTGYVYALQRGTAALEVFRNYQNALQTAGFSSLFACDDDDACGDGEILAQHVYVGSHIMQNSGLRSAQAAMYGNDIHFLSAKRNADGRDIYVSLLVARESSMGGSDTDSISIVLHMIEPKPMADSMVIVDAARMASDIARTGHVALYGIYFDTDSAAVKPESDPALKEIAALLKREPGLKVYIVGHTDTQGGYDHNMGLSARRSRAVAEALASRFAISSDRMHAAGVGFLSPVATNSTDEGRARNRRVELVRE